MRWPRDAPCVFDAPISGDLFRASVKQVPAPTLRPGDVVVMDNPGSHKGAAMRKAIRAAGADLPFRCSGNTPHRGLF